MTAQAVMSRIRWGFPATKFPLGGCNCLGRLCRCQGLAVGCERPVSGAKRLLFVRRKEVVW